MILKNPIIIQINKTNIKKALNLETKIIVNNICQNNIINKENKPPMYHKLVLLLNLHDSHRQKNLCFEVLNIISPLLLYYMNLKEICYM